MFLTYKPVSHYAKEAIESGGLDLDMLRERRVTAWRESLPGEVGEPGDARENNAAAEPATLTPLGERLLGSRPW